jgi:crotonobetaine/carnitine-CoA ligase
MLLRGKGAELGPNATRFPLAERTMLHVLRHRAEQHPDRTWLVFDGRERLTYGEAQQRVNQVGHALGGPMHVGLFLRNQPEFFPAFYGTMAARGVAVPLNADARGVLLERVITKAELRVIVARADLLDRLEALDSLGAVELVVVAGATGPLPERLHAAHVVSWEDWLANQPTTAPAELPDSSDVALIQFTSGTTGSSKGVVYPHHFLYLYSAHVTDSLGHTEDDVLSTPLPLFHVAALHIVSNSALHAGATGHLKSRFSASQYWQQIADDGATFSILLGTLAAILMKTVPEAPPHHLRALFCLPAPPDKAGFEERYGVKILWQGYGMTEVYPHPMPREMEERVPPDTIGHPGRWMEYGVVDEHDQILPPNTPGELVYRSLLPDGMAREYYKEPAATVATWRNFMFHTGDIAYLDDDGRVHYRGRKQDRIRRRGENVSAAELEQIALGHPAVGEAAAFGVPGEFGEHEIKLDVVCVSDVDLRELHAWLQERLPRFMVPRYLEQRPAFPKTPSERIEKYKLAGDPLERPEVLEFEPARR